jgi:lipoprotein-releasing system ATP-binding protein
MSKELERMLSQPTPKLRPTPVGPRLHVVSRGDEADVGEGDNSRELTAPGASEHASRELLAPGYSADSDVPSTAKRIDPPNLSEQAEQLQTIDLHKSYHKSSIEVPVLRGVSMSVRRSEFLAIVGQSGSGKSTLLHLLGTLDAPDQGEIYYGGQRVDNLNASGRDALRNRSFGMIFQFYHLLPELTTLENVLTPLMITHGVWNYLRNRRTYRARAAELLEMVGLSHRLKHRPRELSGGEMQRAAIARALVVEPDLLLADEPTGNLDQGTGQEIIRILRTLNHQRNLTIVMVTHDRAIADQADRIVRLTSGRIEE